MKLLLGTVFTLISMIDAQANPLFKTTVQDLSLENTHLEKSGQRIDELVKDKISCENVLEKTQEAQGIRRDILKNDIELFRIVNGPFSTLAKAFKRLAGKHVFIDYDLHESLSDMERAVDLVIKSREKSQEDLTIYETRLLVHLEECLNN